MRRKAGDEWLSLVKKADPVGHWRERGKVGEREREGGVRGGRERE